MVQTPQGPAQLNNRSPFTCDHISYASLQYLQQLAMAYNR